MQATDSRATSIMQRLADLGYRLTSKRAAIAEAIAARPTQFTARELVDELKPHRIGRATVFRALDLLVQVGLLERLHGDLSCHSYTYCAPEHHHHLVCTACGQVTSIVAGTVERELRNVARRAKFRPDRHHVEIFGLCHACQTKTPPSPPPAPAAAPAAGETGGRVARGHPPAGARAG
jgi:Fe2+ or Zn2+ uptake regulation protein